MESMRQSEQNTAKARQSSKVDPSFKSKRYRDKLRTEVKALETLLPVDRHTLNRKLDSQTVYRLVIAYLRIHAYIKSTGIARNPILENNSTLQEHIKSQDIPDESKNTFNVIESRLFNTTTLSEVLDGFMLLISTDGTIIFATENVHNYTGFNQVDLLHRCFYGVIHPFDHEEVRDIFEAYSFNVFSQKDQNTMHHGYKYAHVSFFCRIKCFHGNRSGYIKIYCTGKLQQSSSQPTTVKTSNNVVLLYCQPFFTDASSTADVVQNNVFWTKHDMALKFVEIQDIGNCALGYENAELFGQSLYQFVHPQDLCALACAHKSMTEMAEAQRLYLRFQTRDGRWMWVLTKGKVICKISRKFSIVLTHCPLMDECTFIDQAELTRHRVGKLDFVNFVDSAEEHESSNFLFTFLNETHRPERTKYISDNHTEIQLPEQSPYISDDRNHMDPQFAESCCLDQFGYNFNSFEQNNEMNWPLNYEASSIFYQRACAYSSCPSSLHTKADDRHSPVLPSNYVSHKASYKERQHQLIEFRRKQFLKQNYIAYLNNNLIHNRSSPLMSHAQQGLNTEYNDNRCQEGRPCLNVVPAQAFVMVNDEQFIINDSKFTMSQPFPHPYQQCPNSRSPFKDFYTFNNDPYQHFVHIPYQSCNYCEQCQNDNILTAHTEQFYIDVNAYCTSSKTNNMNMQCACIHKQPGHYHSSDNVKLSMLCNPTNNYMENQHDINPHSYLQQNNRHPQFSFRSKSENNGNIFIKAEDLSGACAISNKHTKKHRGCMQYDIEASIHMRIVETECEASSMANADINIPCAGGYMDYIPIMD